MFATKPETAIIIDRIADLLRALSIDDLLPYAQIDAVAGTSVRDRFRYLARARDRVERESGLRFETVYRIGIKKISGTAVAGIGTATRRRIGKQAARQAKRLTGLRYNNIDADTQREIDRERSLLGLIHHASSTKAAKAVVITSGAEPPALILQQLLKHGGNHAA